MIEVLSNSLFTPIIKLIKGMAFCLKDIVRTSVILLLTISLCMAIIQSVTTRFTGNKRASTRHTTLHNISELQCVRKCYREQQNGMCTLAGYNKTLETCYLSVNNPENVMDTTDEKSGVFFYEADSIGILRFHMYYIVII